MRKRRFVVGMALVGAALGATFLILLLRPSGEAQPVARDGRLTLIAPVKRKLLPDVDGPTLIPPPPKLRLRALAGKPAFIGVWASWCVPCRQEAPLLSRLWRKYRNRVQFLGIDVEDARSDARAFVRRYGLRYPHIFDRNAALATKLGFFGLPTTYLVDRRAGVAAKLVGKQEEATLRDGLDALVRSSTVP
jgi:thiol-disulfide isomerase/thioredoxin